MVQGPATPSVIGFGAGQPSFEVRFNDTRTGRQGDWKKRYRSTHRFGLHDERRDPSALRVGLRDGVAPCR